MMRVWALRVLLLTTAVIPAGCGSLQVQFQVRRDGAVYQTLSPGQGLSQGDRFALQVQLLSPGYVYVARSRPGEPTQALYPLGSAVRLPAGGPQRIPADGNDLTVPSLQSDEQLCVVISETPAHGDLPHCPPTARIKWALLHDVHSAHSGTSEGGSDSAAEADTSPSGGGTDTGTRDEKQPPSGPPKEEKKPEPKGEKKPGTVDENSRPTEQEQPKGEDKPGSVTKDNRPTEAGVTIVPIPLSACPIPRADSHRRALLVGIDHYIPARSGAPRARDLRGANNDVESVRALLRRRYGFRDDEICVLRDEDATRDTIIGTLRSFVIERTKPGDQVFWFYAGHGSQAHNPQSLEENRQDETIVPADANLHVPDLRDKELHRLFSEVLDRGGKLVALFDSCHSGSVTMGGAGHAGHHPQDGDDDMDVRFRFAEPARVPSPLVPPLPQPLYERGALILTAAQSDQKSQERKIRGVPHGVFTAALEEALKDDAIEPSVTQLRQNIEAHVRAWARIARQTPGFAASATRQSQTLFGETAAEGHYVTVNSVSGPDVFISGGLVLGLDEGAELERTTLPPLKLRVSKVLDLTNSVAEIEPDSAGQPAIGDLFRVHRMRSANRPVLHIWLGEIGPDAAELDSARLQLQALVEQARFTWADSEHTATHRLRYHAGAWELNASSHPGPLALGVQLTGTAVQQGLPPGARLFVEWPLNRSEHQSLRQQLDSVGARALYADGQQALADYVLRGHLAADLRFALEQEPAHQRSNMPTHTKSGDTASLISAVQTLVRLHLWLTLPSPIDGQQGFPYRMRLVGLDNSQRELLPGGQSRTGESYYLKLSRDSSVPNTSNQRRFVYLCAVSSTGGMELLYPRTGGDQKNRLPVTADGPPEIDLRDTSKFRTGGDASIDTYVMLTSEEAIGHPAQLCSSEQRMDSRAANLPQPHRWSFQRIEVRHQP